MMSTLPGRAHRRALPIGLLAAVAAAFVAISPVMADTVVKHHGKTGVGTLNEAVGDIVCNYDATALSLLSIDIASPNLFARDATPQVVDTQWVGWQLIIKRTGGGLPAVTGKSPVRKARTTDATSASFNKFQFVLDFQPPATVKYSVSIKFYWYKPNGRTVAGWALHRADNYTWRTPSFVGDYPAPACRGHWGT